MSLDRSSKLPFADEFKQRFGEDVSGLERVPLQQLSQRANAGAVLGAYHDGRVAFRDSEPDRDTAFHEYIHSVQDQGSGMALAKLSANTNAMEGFAAPDCAAEQEAHRLAAQGHGQIRERLHARVPHAKTEYNWQEFWSGFSSEIRRQCKSHRINSFRDLIPMTSLDVARQVFNYDYSSAKALWNSMLRSWGGNLNLRPDLSQYDLRTAYGAGVCAAALLMLILLARNRKGKSSGRSNDRSNSSNRSSNKGSGGNKMTSYQRGNRTFEFNTGHAANSSHQGHSLPAGSNISQIEGAIASDLNGYLNRGGTLPKSGASKSLTTKVNGVDIGYKARWVGNNVRISTYYKLNGY